MTTTAREDRKPGPRTGAPDIGPPITPPPKLRRRPGLVVAAVVITALGCLLGAWAWNATTSTEEVLAARDTIHRGEVITADDIQRIRISGDPALEPLPASAYDEIVGQRAALDISAGGLITTESTTDAPMPPEGQSIVGISLTPAQVPALPMHGGDKVRIIVTPADERRRSDRHTTVHRGGGRRHRHRRDHRQHRRQRPGALRRRERARSPCRDRQRRAGPRLRGRVMAVVCLTSASGSPGVTTTAVGIAFCWPRPVLLVEADPTGGSGVLAGIPARHDAVRRRVDRARALTAGHGGRAARRRTAADPERLPRGRHPVARSGRGAARCLGAIGRGTPRPGRQRPGRHRRRAAGSASSGSPTAAARRRRR